MDVNPDEFGGVFENIGSENGFGSLGSELSVP
jgi:hypothetical protein